MVILILIFRDILNLYKNLMKMVKVFILLWVERWFEFFEGRDDVDDFESIKVLKTWNFGFENTVLLGKLVNLFLKFLYGLFLCYLRLLLYGYFIFNLRNKFIRILLSL